MKKLILIFAVLMTGCVPCALSQIPPQFIIAGPGCTATVPDYTTKAQITYGCTGGLTTQIPTAGTVLTSVNPIVTVTIKATGSNGKSSQKSFLLTMIDTITPVISAGLLSETITKQIDNIYTAAENLVFWSFNEINNQSWVDTIPGLKEKLLLEDQRKFLVVASSFNLDGSRNRFIARADSVNLISKIK